jgi:hypothetical protein
MGAVNISSCKCRKCGKWHSHIVNGVCIKCRKKLREGKLLLKNSHKDLRTSGVYY